MLDLHIKKKLSQAFDANLHVSMETSKCGIKFSFMGFSDKLEVFIEMFFREFTNVDEIVTESAFEQFMSKEKKRLVNEFSNIDILGYSFFQKLLLSKCHIDYDLYKALDGTTVDKVQKILPAVLEKLKIKILAQGNITKEETMGIVKILDWSFDNEPHTEVIF
jgi:secreted Zn-dependent insulinase-like peptidase